MGYYTDLALRKAEGLIQKSGQPLSRSDALSEVFKERPDLYEEYVKESVANSPLEQTVSGRIHVTKTVGQLAAEGIAKQLVAKSAAEDMNAALDQVFRMRPDLYELHASEICSPRSGSAA